MTPLQQQYTRIKKQFPDTIVFFRLGDFYETFNEDAKIVSSVCNIVLTGREMGTGNRVPLAGIPYHAVDNYLAKLIRAGHKVAIVEQTSEEAARGLMSREVVRVVTPGTVVEPGLLQEKQNNYLAALVTDKGHAGIAYVDITTGVFAATEILESEVQQELDRLQPSEVLVDQRTKGHPPVSGADNSFRLSPISLPDLDSARQMLSSHFQVASLDGFGLSGLPLATRAAGAILQYLQDNQRASLAQLNALRVYSTRSYMTLDPATRRNLELVATIRTGSVKGSLLGVLDETRTPMGGRLLREWITQPLLDVGNLNARLDRVEKYYRNTATREGVRHMLKGMSDLERLTSRVLQGIATPRDLLGIRATLDLVPKLLELLPPSSENGVSGSRLPVMGSRLDATLTGAEHETRKQDSETALAPCPDAVEIIRRAISPEAPATLANGGVIARGFSAELDGIVSAARNAKEWVANLERKERERTGIKSLKVGYNKVFGYYIEITTANLGQVPSEYIRKQTLVNAERFITPELKEYESLILNAEERVTELETTLFREVCAQIAGMAPRLFATARAIAEIDAHASLAEVAVRNRYVRPLLDDGDEIRIVAGRHPVVELALKDEPFVPNDVEFTPQASIHIITGPNMSGKSTFMRQVALIVLMAQVGSFVPAESAHIGLVDRIFTRIGAQDEIAAGQSTFMAEMVETANILRNSTPKSLIILDEIGRGTSTYDGIAIAQAVVEYIHSHPKLGAKTLFATHYHELIDLEKYLPKVRNFNVAVLEQEKERSGGSADPVTGRSAHTTGKQVVFLHKIVPGGADKSYGIHVAQLAGIPKSVVHRAEEVLTELESRHEINGQASESGIQLSLFSPQDSFRDQVSRIDVLSLSPLEALNKLFELVEKAKEKRG